jgi:hypothetical protein
MPKLGQTIETPAGTGLVVLMQVLKELVTIRFSADDVEATFPRDDLRFEVDRRTWDQSGQ